MKIMLFTEGTATDAPSREQRKDYASYVPTESAVEKLTKWQRQGAEICYLTSRPWSESENLNAVQATLRRFNFPAGELYYRQQGEEYVDVVARVRPDVLIEDDCKSIGWDEVITPKLRTEWGIKGIIVPEFGGLAHLPNDHQELLSL
ncbi:MAG: hypothetical protein HYY03_07230 [Chloroflexi bacterium]|nr:hypothetical protein [Chloroflexota bacterium]